MSARTAAGSRRLSVAVALLLVAVLGGCYYRPYGYYGPAYAYPPETAEFPEAPGPPPAPLVEPAPPPPGSDAAWLPGHWTWNGRAWRWSPGMYVRAPYPSRTYAPGFWTPGPGRNWVWVPGCWR
ncbi:MAG: YXWGXW repeat-containing protein [Planctomycetes bacterium]|nr:YXWGXW repeat-containing protein [Planctomycetota bacterium]